MDILDYDDYKQAIQDRILSLKKKKSSWTFKKIAAHLEMQATYFSKVFHSDSHHFSDDDLFKIGKILQLSLDEIDFLLLLKSHETCNNTDRKNNLKIKIEKIQKEKPLNTDVINKSSMAFNNEVDYLLNPLCVLIHVALMSEVIRQDPRQLATKLGLKIQKLKEYLNILKLNELIQTDINNPWNITHVKHWRTHFHRDHPLVRTSQNLMRQMSLSRLSQTSEDEKQSLNFTFTLDAEAFEKTKQEFQLFIKKVENISKTSRHNEVYQMNFDLFKWI